MKGYHKALKWLYKTDPYIVIALDCGCGSAEEVVGEYCATIRDGYTSAIENGWTHAEDGVWSCPECNGTNPTYWGAS